MISSLFFQNFMYLYLGDFPGKQNADAIEGNNGNTGGLIQLPEQLVPLFLPKKEQQPNSKIGNVNIIVYCSMSPLNL